MIDENIRARLDAVAVIEIAVETGGDNQRFWEFIRDAALKQAPLPPTPVEHVKPMKDDEARKFGRRVLNFGVHRDKTYDDVPLDYLEWLADQNADLTRYLRSRRIKQEDAA